MLSLLSNWVLGREARSRGATLRTLLAVGAYLVGCVIAEVAYAIGINGLYPTRLFELVSLSVAVLTYGLVRSGVTQRFRDPALTMCQMLIGETLAVAAYCLFHEFRGAMISVSLAVVSFGIFSLTRSQLWAMSLYSLITMGVAMSWMSHRDPQNFPPAVEAVHFLILMLLQFVVGLLGAEFGEMRRRLRHRKRAQEEALAHIQELANKDSLTGLYNRRHTQELMDHHIQLQGRSGRIFSVALIDLDHFKGVNDTYGHAMGDLVLQTFAQQARALTREADIVARWGGEEFIIVMPDTLAEGARMLVERLREQLEGVPVSDEVPDLVIRFSAGITEHRGGENSDAALMRADQALYEAKERGRRCSVVRLP